MNAAAERWCEELESGNYEQGRSRLRIGDRHCCLGVACELAVEAGIAVRLEPADDDRLRGYRYADAPVAGVDLYAPASVLPHGVRRWLGLRMSTGMYSGTSLSERNDSGATFAEIAEIVRGEPDGLFLPEEA